MPPTIIGIVLRVLKVGNCDLDVCILSRIVIKVLVGDIRNKTEVFEHQNKVELSICVLKRIYNVTTWKILCCCFYFLNYVLTRCSTSFDSNELHLNTNQLVL